MRIGPVLATTAAVAAVVVGATAVLGMAASGWSTATPPTAVAASAPAPSSIPAQPSGAAAYLPGIAAATPDITSSAPSARRSATPAATAKASSRSAPATKATVVARSSSAPAPPPPPVVVRGQALPLGYATGSATRVITVVAGSTSSTTAVLQAWTKAPGGGWLRWGPALTAHVGSAGLTTHPSESLSATPIGTFTLTRAFGHDANPGSGLPYHVTSPSDWWISQPGSLYNTMQTCSGICPFTQGNPNEHLYYETPFYNYAVVINYNVSPVVQGAGSAFFLHVTDGTATAGCVAIPQANLVAIMRWLTAASHPRILIGVS